jgi:Arm domain-containing DNA-binding protein/integrase-like protein
MLTDTAIRNAKPRELPYKLGDSRGLYLLVTPSGGKWYRFGGKRKSLSMGTYPTWRLRKPGTGGTGPARTWPGGDPGAVRKAQKELRKAEWAEFDLDRAEWNIAAIPMKTREPHLVPLSRQAVECLRELYPLTGWGRHVFPGVRSVSRPLSENTVNAALRRLGYAKTDMTGHGFRAMAGTILDEVLGVSGATSSSTSLPTPCATPFGRAYNRTTHLAERRDMMQRWADYLDGLKNGAEVVSLRGRLA